jgi:hypothetical protein
MIHRKKKTAKSALCSHCFETVNNLTRHLAQCLKVVISQNNIPSNIGFMTEIRNASAPSSSRSHTLLLTTDRTIINWLVPSDLASVLTGDSINTEGPFLSELKTQNRNIAVKDINQMEKEVRNMPPLGGYQDEVEMEVEPEDADQGDLTFAPGDATNVPNYTDIIQFPICIFL